MTQPRMVNDRISGAAAAPFLGASLEKKPDAPKFENAVDFLQDGVNQLSVKAQMRDAPQGERSMATTVKTFNALTGLNLTEAEGWKFMVCLKMVRGQQGRFNPDDYVDGAAYMALLGECEAKRDQ